MSKSEMLIYNVEANQFLTGGGYWGTQASISNKASAFLLTDSINAESEKLGWTLQNQDSTALHRDGTPRVGYFAFNDGASMYLDMGDQGHNFWSIEKQDNGYYRIRQHANDANYGSSMANYDNAWFGHISTTTDSTLVTTADPDNTDYISQIDWAFVDPADYDAWVGRKVLYDALVEAEATGLTIDWAAEDALYKNEAATTEELLAAAQALKTKIQNAKVYAVLDGASEDDPKDGTSLLVNADLSEGSMNGWTNTFVSGKTASNVQYQGATYTNNDTGVTVSGFIEAWTNQAYGSGSQSLGVGEISQTLKSLPAGKYELGMDVIAVHQPNPANTTGVQLFAKGGDIDNHQPVKTGNEKPEHFNVTFFSTGGDVTLGLRTNEENTANWIGIDNMTLTYYGPVTVDPHKLVLDQVIEGYETQYPDMEAVKANTDVKAAYEAAIEAGKEATGDYEAATQAVRDAADALAKSVEEYVTAEHEIQVLLNTIDQANENGWEELIDALGELQDEIQGKYADCLLTSEEIADIANRKNELIGAYISENVKAGEDVTLLLKNPGFDENFSGWDVDKDKATPVWGGMGLINTIVDGVQPDDLKSGNAEVYRATFDISQTIKNMPLGLYTLSCQAFGRDDNGDDIQAELYAVIDGKEQTVKVKNLLSEGSPEQLFQVNNLNDDGDGFQSDKQNGPAVDGENTWVPNGMNGSNVYFAAGFYKNQFNILVTKQTDIKVGIRDNSGADWVLFDDFKLVYQGADKAAFDEAIQNLINELATKGDNGILTREAETKAAEAITAGENATDSQSCIDAIQQLQDAIAFSDQTLKATAELEAFYFELNEILIGTIEGSTDESLSTAMEKISIYVDGSEAIETNQQVAAMLQELKTGWTAYVAGSVDMENASEETPADITPAILTPSSVDDFGVGSTKHWTMEGNFATNEGVTEIFNQAKGDFSQTIYGLVPGFYKLGVQGLYRGQGNTPNMDATPEDTLKRNVTLYAGEKVTRLASLKSGAEAYNALVEGTTEGKWVTPNTMTEANNAFENDLYHNYLLFEVKEGEQSVTIGLHKEAGVADDWLIFDNWTLEYLGANAPAEDPTTAVNGVEVAGEARIEIYSVGGTRQARLLKGVNIIKTVQSDGTVKMQKVLVR